MNSESNTPEEEQIRQARRRMLREDIHDRGMRDRAVLQAMDRVPRHVFVDVQPATAAYEDRPIQIGFGQTISQPYIVALMTHLLEVQPGARILEIGTGCGYQTAVLLELGAFVFSVEVIPELATAAEQRLARQGFQGFRISCHDGHAGWPEYAPFDGAILAAAPERIPPAILNQIAPGGIVVVPVGRDAANQQLEKWRRDERGWNRETICPVRFVPLITPENQP